MHAYALAHAFAIGSALALLAGAVPPSACCSALLLINPKPYTNRRQHKHLSCKLQARCACMHVPWRCRAGAVPLSACYSALLPINPKLYTNRRQHKHLSCKLQACMPWHCRAGAVPPSACRSALLPLQLVPVVVQLVLHLVLRQARDVLLPQLLRMGQHTFQGGR